MKECPQHMSTAAPTTTRAIYKLEREWSGSTNNDPCSPQQFNLGPRSSQYAEIAAILITLQMAASHNIKELLICTDSNYARLSFTCHLAGWKQNGFKTANNKPVKHQELFQAGDAIVTEHDIIVYWKRFEVIHVNQDKTKTSMTRPMPSPKQVHYTESPGHFKPSLPTLQ